VSREPGWRREGAEPDYRFSLANERTFLAWIRTALAVLAGGVLLQQFSTKLEPQIAVVAVATLLCCLAAVLCLQAYGRWRANEIAMRHGQKLPHTRALLVLAIGTFITAFALAGLILHAAYRGS
jgi:putative membrane protein